MAEDGAMDVAPQPEEREGMVPARINFGYGPVMVMVKRKHVVPAAPASKKLSSLLSKTLKDVFVKHCPDLGTDACPTWGNLKDTEVGKRMQMEVLEKMAAYEEVCTCASVHSRPLCAFPSSLH
jgi:hypothetical protein